MSHAGHALAVHPLIARRAEPAEPALVYAISVMIIVTVRRLEQGVGVPSLQVASRKLAGGVGSGLESDRVTARPVNGDRRLNACASATCVSKK